MRRTGRGDGLPVVVLCVPHSPFYRGRRRRRRVDCPIALACLFISLSSIFEWARNDAIPFIYRPVPPPSSALLCLRPSYSPPPSGSWDEWTVAMIAWRVPPPACLPVVDLPVSPSMPSCVSSGVAGSGAYSPPVPSRLTAPCPSLPAVLWALFMSLASCFDELPSRASYLFPIIARLVWRLVVLVS